MELSLIKSNIDCNEIVQRLMKDTPSIIKFSETIRGWTYKDKNLKISIKHNLLNSGYRITTNLCGIKSSSILCDAIVRNFGLLKCMIFSELAKLFKSFDIPSERFISDNKYRLIANDIFAVCIIAYNLESDTRIVTWQNDEKSVTELRFKEGNIMKLTIKNSDNSIKSYYNQGGSIRTKVLGLIRAL